MQENNFKNKKSPLKMYYLFYASMCFFVLSNITLGLSKNGDWGWQIKAGQWMVNNRSLLLDDIFSWLSSDLKTTWYNQEWLSEIIMYIFSTFTYGTEILIILATAIILFLCFKLSTLYKYDTSIPRIIFTGFMIVSAFMIKPRPFIAGLIFFIIELYIIERHKINPTSKGIYFIPVIAVLWINFHGGSSNLSYILLIIYSFSRSVRFKLGDIVSNPLVKKECLKLWATSIITFFSLMINPYGIKMLIYPYTNMFDSQMTTHVTEWHSPSIKTPGDWIIFALTALLIFLIFVLKQDKIDLHDILSGGFCILMAFVSYRHVIFLWVISFLIANKYMHTYESIKKNVLTYICIGLIAFNLTLLLSGSNTSKKEDYINSEAIEYLQNEQHERLYNSYNFGGYLIMNDIPVFMDGRYELYASTTFSDYIDIYNMMPGAHKLIGKYNFDCFITDKECALWEYLSTNDNYKLVYDDDFLSIFEPMS